MLLERCGELLELSVVDHCQAEQPDQILVEARGRCPDTFALVAA